MMDEFIFSKLTANGDFAWAVIYCDDMQNSVIDS
jgi:hypothetical protein